MAGLGTLSVYLSADTNRFKKGMNSAVRGVKGFERQLNTVVKGGMLALGAGFVALSIKAIKAGSDLEETNQKFSVTFSNVANEAKKASAELQKSYGMAEENSKNLLASTGDLLTGFGFTQDKALELSRGVQKLAVDLASFQNLQGGSKRASEALTKGLLGERESMKSLGIAILEKDVKERVSLLTTKGMTFETERQAKAYATLQLAQEQSKNALGDFARSQDSVANRWKVFNERISDFLAQLGMIESKAGGVADIIGGLTEKIESLTNWVKTSGAEWANTFKIITIEVKFAFKQMWGFAQTLFNNVVIGILDIEDTVGTMFSWLVDAFKKVITNWDTVLAAWMNDWTDNFKGFGKAVIGFFKGEGWDFELQAKSLKDAFENIEIKPPEFGNWDEKYKNFSEKMLEIDEDREKALEDMRLKSYENINKKINQKKPPPKDDPLVKLVASQPQFAGALERGTVQAFSAELRRQDDPQAEIADASRSTAENTKSMVDILKEQVKNTKIVSISSANKATG